MTDALGPMHGTQRLYLFHDQARDRIGHAPGWLIEHGARFATETEVRDTAQDDVGEGLFVCVIDAGTNHESAAIMYDRAETNRHLALTGVVSKEWFYCAKDQLLLACPELVDHPWAEEG